MDDRMKMRVALLMKTVRSCYLVAVMLAVLSAVVFVWGLLVLLNNSGCKTCAISGSSFVIMPLMFLAAIVGLIVALTERGEARFVMGVLSGTEKEKLQRMNKVRLILGFVPLILTILEFVFTVVII